MESLECKIKKFKFLIVKKSDEGVFTITLNNPKQKNALNLQMIKELKDTLTLLKEHSETRLLCITGSGNVFSSGADLDWMKRARNLNLKENKVDALNFTSLLKQIDCFPKPTIAIINGHVFGGGLGIIAACDYSIANSEAKFSFSEVKLGIIPAMIAPYIIRNIGYKKSKNLFLTGEVFNTEKAMKIELIDYNAEESRIENIKNVLIKKLLQGNPRAQQEIKQFLSLINYKEINKNLIDLSADTISNIRVTSDAKEGIDAFLEKRKPKWII